MFSLNKIGASPFFGESVDWGSLRKNTKDNAKSHEGIGVGLLVVYFSSMAIGIAPEERMLDSGWI
jgi:hypothetical protein